MTAKALAKLIKKTRQDLGLTQGELAIKLGISSQLISAFEAGRIRPQRKYLLKLANFAQLPLAVFTGDRVEEALTRLAEVEKQLTYITGLLRDAAGSDDS